MSIELPQYAIHIDSTEPAKLSVAQILGLIFFGIIIGLLINYVVLSKRSTYLHDRNIVLENSASELQDIIAQHKAEISLLNTEQKVTQQAVKVLQEDYSSLMVEKNKFRSEIQFYEKLLSPNIKNRGLRVFESNIYQTDDNKYLLKLALVHKIEKAKETSGRLKVSIVGTEGQKPKTIKIKTKDMAYKFKYFQNISYTFFLPNSFNPAQLVVELLPKNKKLKSVKYTVDWQIEKK